MSRELPESGVLAPTARASTVPRPRCRTVLDRAVAQRRLAVLIAPAGYGKTTLLHQWSQSAEHPVAWVERPAAATPDGMRLEIAHALTRAQRPRRVAAASDAALGDAGQQLEAALQSAPTGTVVVVDDVHEYPRDAVAEVLGPLVRDDRVRMVLASRSAPPLGVPRLRIDGMVTELRARDLAFSAEETAVLAQMLRGERLQPEAAADLVEVTDGWPTAVRLALLPPGPAGDTTRTLGAIRASDLDLSAYLVEEVLDSLPAELAAFVLRATVDDLVDPGLAEELVAGGAALLQECLDRELFCSPVGGADNVCRWNPLFAAQCRSIAAARFPAVTRLLHRKAALHLAEHDLGGAFRHALAAHDPALATTLLVERWPDLAIKGEGWAVVAMADQLAPPYRTDLDVVLARQLAWASIEPSAARREPLPPVDPDDPHSVVAHAVLTILQSRPGDDIGDAVRHAVTAAEEPGLRPATHALALFAAASGEALRAGDGLQVLEVASRASALAESHGLTALRLASDADRAFAALFVGGRAAEADDLARRSLDEAIHRGWSQAPALYPAWLTRAAIALWQGRWSDVGQLCDPVSAEQRDDRHAALRGAAEMLHGLARVMAGDLIGARQVRQRLGRALGARATAPVWEDVSTIIQAATADAAGDRPAVLAALRAPVPQRNSLLRLIVAALLRSAGDRTTAQRELDLAADASRSPLGRAFALAVRAGLAADHGEPARAHALLEELLATNADDRFVLPFRLAGLRDLLVAHRGWRTANEPAVRRLLELVPQPAATTATGGEGALTDRELEVLACLRAGMSSQEVADALVVSINTIKTHQRAVYRKLGVEDRRAAVRLAVELGLL